MIKYKLFYLPYAGASTKTFKNIQNYLGDEIEAIVIDYPGHGERFCEDYVETVEEICLDTYERLKECNSEGLPYFIAGHCLGGLVAFELCHKIMELGEMALPEKIFISGHNAPDKIVEEHLNDKENSELLHYLYEQGAIGKEMLDESLLELVSGFYIPPIRRDADVYDSYICNLSRAKINVPISILYGENDWKCSMDGMKHWDDFTEKGISMVGFPENHYFVISMQSEYFTEIKNEILA